MVEAVNTQGSYWGKTAKRTAIVGGVAAGISAGMKAAAQKLILKYPKKMVYDNYGSMVKNIVEFEKKAKTGKLKELIQNAKEMYKPWFDFVKAGKMDWKSIGKGAGKAALIAGGIYLAYRGIRALFTKND